MGSKTCTDLASWAGTLLAIARHALASYEQHLEAVNFPGLVPAVVQCLSGSLLTFSQHDIQQVLLAFKALSISRSGEQALIVAGACHTLCTVLTVLAAQSGSRNNSGSADCYQQRYKRARLDPKQGRGDALQDAVKLLAVLLLESPARPAVGSLTHAEEAFAAMQQVMFTAEWQNWRPALQQDSAGVFARLAMEPAVKPFVLCTLDNTTSTAALATNAAGCNSSSSCEDALITLLGSTETAADFLQHVWETKAAHYLLRVASLPCTSGSMAELNECGSQCELQRQQQASAAHAEGSMCGGLKQLLGALTVTALFEQVLPSAWHCPVMGVDETDAVQHLVDLHRAGQLLQPLQHNQDTRLIRAVSGLQKTPQDDVSLPPGHKQLQQQDSTEQLLAFDGPVMAESCAAASQLHKEIMGSGFSLVLRDLPKRVEAVAQLVNSIEQQLGLPAGVNLYFTPPGAQGLKAHYDDHCVFVYQLSGSKAWLMAPPQEHQTQLPLTYQPRIPVILATLQELENQRLQHVVGQQYSAETQQVPGAQPQRYSQQHMLLPGDVLYIPRGWVHQARTPKQHAATAAKAKAGAMSVTEANIVNATNGVAGISATEASGSSAGNAEQSAAVSAAAEGSLHMSVGVEVEPRFSVQGYLHCLIEHACRTGVGGRHGYYCQCCANAAAGMCEGVPRTAAVGAAVPAGDYQEGCGGVGQARPGSASDKTAAAAAAGTTAGQQLASRAAAMLFHILLWQRASKHAEFRRAFPVLMISTEVRLAATIGLVRQMCVAVGSQETALLDTELSRVQRCPGSSAGNVEPAGGVEQKQQADAEQTSAAELHGMSSLDQCWINLALGLATSFQFAWLGPAHSSMVQPLSSVLLSNALGSACFKAAARGAASTGRQMPIRPTSSAAGEDAFELTAGQLLVQLDVELLQALKLQLQAQPEPELSAAPELRTPVQPCSAQHAMPGTPNVLGWVAAVQDAVGVAAAAAAPPGMSTDAAPQDVSAVNTAVSLPGSCSFPAGGVPKSSRHASSQCCRLCTMDGAEHGKSVYTYGACSMQLALQVLMAALEAHATQGSELAGHWQLRSAAEGATSNACTTDASTPNYLSRSSHVAVSGDNSTLCQRCMLVQEAVVRLPRALQQLWQALRCRNCRQQAGAGLVQTAHACLAARTAVRHAHLALHSVGRAIPHMARAVG